MKTTLWYLCSFGLLITLSSCDSILDIGFTALTGGGGGGNRGPRTMMVPVYEDSDTVRMVSARPAENLSRIYSFPPYVFLVEEGKGLHIVNNLNPKEPKNMRFLNIPKVKDIEFSGNICYASTGHQIMAIALLQDTAVLLQRLLDPAVVNLGQEYPLNYTGYFVCPDLDRKVIDWQKEIMYEEPNCRK